MTARTPEPAAPLVEALEREARYAADEFNMPAVKSLYWIAADTLRAQQEEIARYRKAMDDAHKYAIFAHYNSEIPMHKLGQHIGREILRLRDIAARALTEDT